MSGQDSGTMWANMLGLGGLMQTVNDPAFHEQIRAFVAAIADTQARVIRIEAKLDALLAGFADGRFAAAAFAQLGADGCGLAPLTGGAVDDGAGAAAPETGGAGNGARKVRPDRISGGIAT